MLENKLVNNHRIPLVSIGMPVYNCEDSIRHVLKSLLAQTFTDFELIISDNGSNDGTGEICQEFAAKDSRIIYVRQSTNRGGHANFQYVLDCSKGKYFMWAAGDDVRSQDFLEVNVNALEANPTLSASTTPNCFEGEQHISDNFINFTLQGNRFQRYRHFLRNAWTSHGIFYSLMRSDIIKLFMFPNCEYFALDWSIDMFLLSRGEIFRTTQGVTIFGVNGNSRRRNPREVMQSPLLDLVLPLNKFTLCILPLLKEIKLGQSIIILLEIAKLNVSASMSNLKLLTIFALSSLLKNSKLTR